VQATQPDVPAQSGTARTWLIVLIPLILLGVLVVTVLRSSLSETFRGEGAPPIEKLTFQRVVLNDDGITLTVLNDGPDPVTLAQVAVDDAYWAFEADGGTELQHLQRTRLHIPYPWVEGEAHFIKVLTSTGTPFEHEIAVAVKTPEPSGRFAVVFTLIGLYVGVIPVAIGLLWYPMMARLRERGLDFVLALTIGLLLFLLADALHEGVESSAALPGSYQGIALLTFGFVGAYLILEAFGGWLRNRRKRVAASQPGWVLALTIAVGIGLHNFGEGLAIGAAFALGEAALGTLLIIGFALHNTTEGLAIVAPLSKHRVSLTSLVLLGIVGGAPTIAGALLGGFTYSPVLAVLFLGIGAGAIAQVLVQIAGQVAGSRRVVDFFASAPALAGLFAGFIVMYATGMLVG
jgi:zinc transporter ZupT